MPCLRYSIYILFRGIDKMKRLYAEQKFVEFVEQGLAMVDENGNYHYKCRRCQIFHKTCSKTAVVIALEKNKMCCKYCFKDYRIKNRPYIEYPRRTNIPLDYPLDETKGIADIYIRVSSWAQADGHGLIRQEEGCIGYCRNNGIGIRNIIQDVMSAWRKDNFVTGNLGYKVKQWRLGVELPPNFLVIEDWERLSRQGLPNALNHYTELRQMGIEIVSIYDILFNRPTFNDLINLCFNGTVM